MNDWEYTDAQVDQCIAQAKRWAGSRDNGWTPSREQVMVLATEVESLRAEVARLREQQGAMA